MAVIVPDTAASADSHSSVPSTISPVNGAPSLSTSVTPSDGVTVTLSAVVSTT